MRQREREHERGTEKDKCMNIYRCALENGRIGACGIANKHLLFSPIEWIYLSIYKWRCDDNDECSLWVYIYKIVIHFQEIHPLHIVNKHTHAIWLFTISNNSKWMRTTMTTTKKKKTQIPLRCIRNIVTHSEDWQWDVGAKEEVDQGGRKQRQCSKWMSRCVRVCSAARNSVVVLCQQLGEKEEEKETRTKRRIIIRWSYLRCRRHRVSLSYKAWHFS